MSVTDYVLLTGSICGIMMVLGGILLLYRGAISLAAVSPEQALSIEYKKELRLSTQYPALGFFLIGLLFVAFSIVMAPEPEQMNRKLKIIGTAMNVEEPITVRVIYDEYNSRFKHLHEIKDIFSPEIDAVQVQLTAVGYEPVVKTYLISSLTTDEIDLGEVRMRQAISEDEITTSAVNNQ